MLKQWISLFTLTFLAGSAAALTPPYHVNDGYYGSVTIRASGSCGFKPVTYKNVWLGSVLDSTNASAGFGLMTASGQILLLEQDYASLRYKNNTDIGVGFDISYTDMVSQDLATMVTTQSGCALWTIVPDTGSRTTIRWDAYRGYDRAVMLAKFRGFDQSVCTGPSSNQQCRANAFAGSILFQGNRSVPH